MNKDDYILMPKALTAANGAKKLLIGEFKERVSITCCVCDGSGIYGYDQYEYEEVCPDCDGAGEYSLYVQVSWPTIREIYKKAVAGLCLNYAKED